MSVVFRIGSERFSFRVHRLVAQAFIDNPDPVNNTVVNHLDTDRLNNEAGNLEWTTYLGNNRHAVEVGALDIKGEKHFHSRLTEEQVLQIRQLYHTMGGRELSEMFGIGRRHISDVVLGKVWGHLPLEDYSNRPIMHLPDRPKPAELGIGLKLKAIRESQGRSQYELARTSKVNSPHISLVERQMVMPTKKQLVKWCNGLGVSVESVVDSNIFVQLP